MVIALLFVFCACSAPTAGETVAAPQVGGKGRYIESKIELPLPEDATEQQLLGMADTGEGMVYYTSTGKPDGDSWICRYFRHTVNAEGALTTQDMPWLNTLAPLGGNQVLLTQCGDALYFSFSDYTESGSLQNHIVVSRDNGATGTALTGSGVASFDMIASLSALADGRIAVQDVDGGVTLLDADGNLLRELGKSAYNGGIAALGSKVAYVVSAGNAVCVIDVDSGESTQWPIEISELASAQMCFADDGTLYLASLSGLFSHAPQGTLWERFVDGDTTNLGLPGYYVTTLVLQNGENPVLYVSDYQADVYRYAYDPEASQTPSVELDVFSLNENYMMRQAVVLFNRTHSDVKVNYTVATSLAGGGTTQDYIKALNTEILAGTGPDVLLLDGLPMDSYIEKGVLAPIGPVVDNAQPILPNVRKALEKGGELYAIPLGLTVPVAITKGSADAFATLGALADAAQASGGAKLLSSVGYSYETLPMMLLENYGDTLKADDPASVKAFLADAGRLSAAIGSSEVLGAGIDELFGMSPEETREMILEDPFYPQLRDYVLGNTDAAILRLKSPGDYNSMTAAAALEQYGGTLCSLGGRFEPVGMVGLNKAGKEMETAKEFLATLLSTEAQTVSAFNAEYFPVNVEALNAMLARQDDSICTSTMFDETHKIEAAWPSQTMRAQFRTLVDAANVPVTTDEVLSAMLLPELTAYLSGASTLDEAADKIGSTLSTYLME